jgi:hypothetical protein
MHAAVVSHFPRDLKDILRLKSAHVEIEVFGDPVTGSGTYTQLVLKMIGEPSPKPGLPRIIFLDPDTGLEPEKSRPKLEHVRKSDLGKIWRAMLERDVLVFYQHRTDVFQHNNDIAWIEPKRKQFESALGLSCGVAKMARGKAAKDVAFFFAQKLDANSPAESTGNVCPECGHQFGGNGFGGIDGHWRPEHLRAMPYEEAWPLIRAGKYPPKAPPVR